MSFRTLNPTFLVFLEVVQKKKKRGRRKGFRTLWQPHKVVSTACTETIIEVLHSRADAYVFLMDFLSCSNWTLLLIITTSGLHNSHPTRMHKPLCQRIWHVPKWSILLHFKSSRCLSLPIKITFWKNCSLLSSVKSTRIRIRDFSNFHWCANIFMCL